MLSTSTYRNKYNLWWFVSSWEESGWENLLYKFENGANFSMTSTTVIDFLPESGGSTTVRLFWYHSSVNKIYLLFLFVWHSASNEGLIKCWMKWKRDNLIGKHWASCLTKIILNEITALSTNLKYPLLVLGGIYSQTKILWYIVSGMHRNVINKIFALKQFNKKRWN